MYELVPVRPPLWDPLVLAQSNAQTRSHVLGTTPLGIDLADANVTETSITIVIDEYIGLEIYLIRLD